MCAHVSKKELFACISLDVLYLIMLYTLPTLYFRFGLSLGLWCLMPLQQYFSYIVVVGFVAGGNWR
jgi:hypothetical protein